MKSIYLFITISLLSLVSCSKSINGICIDDINDRDEIVGAINLNCEYYMNQKVNCLIVNDLEYRADRALTLSDAGFYRMVLFLEGSDPASPVVIRIVILDHERGEAEWGLKKWTPATKIKGQVDNQEINLMHPILVPEGVNVPLIVMTGKAQHMTNPYFQAHVGSNGFKIKQGIGSVQIPPTDLTGAVLTIDHRSLSVETRSFESPPIQLHGLLNSDITIPQGTNLHITNDLTIPSGLTLTINSGTFVSITPEINIYNEGNLVIKGTSENPVSFTCSEPGAFWGGIIGTTSGNSIKAVHAIFCFSGYHTGESYSYGHANRQALIYNERGNLSFEHCYFIDHVGQVFYPVSASLLLKNCLIQRAMTGGQINNSDLTIQACIFTDFPDDSQDYRDEDNDALYLMGSDAVISNSMFMYAKDDGLDSGGSGGGEIRVINSLFEANFHEGAALSSGGNVSKTHHFANCTFFNCGQGLELGYSSPNHLVTADSCLFLKNGIGVRYGDNYITQHLGKIAVTNSQSISNFEYDIWNMVRDSWSADTFKMEFSNVTVSREDPMYPQLKRDE